MRVGCQYERVRYSEWYNFMWNDPKTSEGIISDRANKR